MIKNKIYRSSKILSKYLFYLICFFLPLIQYLNKNNLQEFIAEDIFYFVISLFLLLIILILFYYIFFKKYNYPFLYLILIFNITFIFLPFRDFFLIELSLPNYLSIFLSFLLYTIFTFIPLFFLKKKIFQDFLLRLCVAYFLINFSIISLDKNSLIYNFKEIIKEEVIISDLPLKNNELTKQNNENISNVYFVIVDAMVPFNLAKEFGIINDEEIKKELEYYKKNNFIYVKNSFANYDTTQLSLAGIFSLDYFTKPPNEFTYKKSNVFPVILYHNDNLPLLQVLKLKKIKFYYHGNSWGPCRQSLIVNCHFSKNVQILNRVLLSFYSDTPFFFLTRMLKKIFKDLDQGENRQLGNYQENFSIKEDFKEKRFIFIHHYGSHTPYSRDENCNKKKYPDDDFEGYKNAYRCTLKEIKDFINFLNKNDPNSLVIMQADHGYKAPEKKLIKHSAPIINLIRFPKNCNKYEIPKSNINSIIFSLNCAYNLNLKYKEFIFYEDGYDYPNARFILKKRLLSELK